MRGGDGWYHIDFYDEEAEALCKALQRTERSREGAEGRRVASGGWW